MRRSTLALGGALAVAVALATGPAAAAQDTGTVFVVHGVPDTPVDVYVDGERALDDFQPGTTQGPVELRRIGDVGRDELGLDREIARHTCPPVDLGVERIEARHLMTLVDQRAGEPASDEAGAARD